MRHATFDSDILNKRVAAEACAACAQELELLDLSNACAACVRAELDFCERLSLSDDDPADTTAMLPIFDASSGPISFGEAVALDRTQALPTGVMEALHDASVQDDDPSIRRAHLRKRALFVGAVAFAVALLAAIAVFFSTGGFSRFSAVDVDTVEAALRADPEFMDGSASNDYVEPSSYELSDVEIVDASKESDTVTRLLVSAVLSNKSFRSAYNLTMDFVRIRDIGSAEGFEGIPVPQDAPDSAWVGRIVSEDATTRAISGVDFDPDVPEGFSPSFDESTQTCSYKASDTTSLWLADVTTETTYSYAFDGTAWVRRDPSTDIRTSYKAVEGSYTPAGGAASEFTTFSISDLDTAKGTFTLTYDKSAAFLSTDAISGTIECTIMPTTETAAYADYRQEDGRVYLFEGTGTSDAGEGAARITGVFTPDTGLVFTFQGDYTEQPLLGSPRSATVSKTGSFIK